MEVWEKVSNLLQHFYWISNTNKTMDICTDWIACDMQDITKPHTRRNAYSDMNIMMWYKIRLLVSMFYIYFLSLSDCLKLQKHFNINNVNKKKNQKLTCLVTDSQFFFFFFLWFPISYYSSRTCLCTVNCAQHNLKVIITTH